MDGKYLIVPRATSLYKSTGINIWDLTEEPKLVQVIFNDLGPKGKHFKVYKKFIVQQIGCFIRVHKNINGKYEHFKLLHFKENVRFVGGVFQVMSDVEEIENFVKFKPPVFEDELNLGIEMECNMLAIHKYKKFVYLWNIDPWKEVTAINLDGEEVSYIRIIPGRLFCVMSNSPIFRVFDIEKNVWLMELMGNSRNPLFDLSPTTPTLYLGPHMISSYYKSGSESIYKVWDLNGELVRIMDLPRNVHFQCAFTDDGVLLTSSEQTISLLSNSLDEIKRIEIDSPCEAMDAGPGKSFILVYQTFYQVWDWKSGTKKYTINLAMSVTRQVNSFFWAHEIHHYNHKIKINILNFAQDVVVPV